ncbi:DUF4037 domain-containing protein [Oceanobacillus neutriphilus]|uniref:DUF4037 domain-containing protein n=1 Tax=Oceanobacillus neutriphilus TaxID=531815 RepID=A0ABQ2NVZ7_9BACI|nr:DUF4037 domain-containing protein [Oceanobacillus neutriphilus]GGP11838.1 hypothetical protein GCM10011346_25440 [Oceanobacillus neutriphilus]
MNLNILAEKAAKVYQINPKVEAVLLGGSVSRNWQDSYSDIELFIFWKEPPTDEDRKKPVTKLAGEIIDFYPYEEKEWSETYIAEGIKLEISNFLTTSIEGIIDDIVVSFNPDVYKQCLAAAVYDGVPLSGESFVKQLKDKVKQYPNELSIAMIKEYMFLGNSWTNREALLHRKDWLMLYKVITDVQTHIMGMLSGLNKQYVHHPAFKWQKQTLESMAIAPENISSRLESVFLSDPVTSLSELEGIVLEVYQFIQREHPKMDISPVVGKSLFLRPEHGKE